MEESRQFSSTIAVEDAAYSMMMLIVAADPADDARKNDGGELVFMLMNE